MSVPAIRKATYEDVVRAPAHRIAEILAGELHLSPRPAGPHSAAASALSDELGPPFKRGKGGPGRTLEVLQLESEKWLTLTVHRDDARVRAEPFSAIELDLSVLWADVRLE